MKYDYGIYCGRFQPFHIGHYGRLMNGLLYCDKVIMVVGANRDEDGSTIKNPFTSSQRHTMIFNSILDCHKVQLCTLYDTKTDEEWLDNLGSLVYSIIPQNKSIVLLGAQKDNYTKAYLIQILEKFKWAWQSSEVINTLSATNIRNYLFGNPHIDKHFLEPLRVWVPSSTYEFLEDYIKTPEFLFLKRKFL
jgi:bifunctional NMN adenylyltransferase/nudix hydrolase